MGAGKIYFLAMYLFLIVGFSGTVAYAQDFNNSKGALEVKLLNDSWGGGIGESRDDLRSFGALLAYRNLDKFNISIAFSGLTNRYSPIPGNSGRIDELKISGDFTLRRKLLKVVNMQPIFGILVHSRLGGERIQELSHRIFGVWIVSLPYTDKNRIYAQAGIRFISPPLHLNNGTINKLYIKPEIETFAVPDYVFSLKPEIPLILESSRGDRFSISVAYQYSHSLTKSEILNPVIHAESGLSAEYKINFGFFSLSSISYFHSGYSNGSYGFSFYLDSPGELFKAPDFTIEAGALAGGNGYFHKYLWNKTQLLPTRLLFTFSHQYGSYLRRRLVDYPQVNGMHQQLSLGAEIRMFRLKEKFQLNPYAGLNVGIKREIVYSGNTEIETAEAHSPVLMGEAGVLIKPPSWLYYRNTIWGLSMHYKYSRYFFTDKHTGFREKFRLTSPFKNPGIGLFVIIDF